MTAMSRDPGDLPIPGSPRRSRRESVRILSESRVAVNLTAPRHLFCVRPTEGSIQPGRRYLNLHALGAVDVVDGVENGRFAQRQKRP